MSTTGGDEGVDVHVVTGASRGIGAALASTLAAAGARLLLVARRFPASAVPGAELVETDLTESSAVSLVVDSLTRILAAERPRSVTLINNAGTVEPVAPLDRARPESIERGIRLNLIAPMLLTAAFIRATVDLRIPRRVVNISSGAASSPYAGWSVYCASKAGLDHFTRCVGLEQQDREFPVTCISLAPGVIDTGMQDLIRTSRPEDFPMLERFVALKESGQLVSPSECAQRIVRFLAESELEHGGVYDLRRV